jgi:uncharacterized protein (TIGR03435 family)
LFLLAAAAFAQPSFDVASVKPSAPVVDLYNANLGTIRPGEVTLGNATLTDCIKFAYGLVSDDQVSGPDWIKSRGVRYDIIAKAPPSTPRDQLLMMLRGLLTERFHLAFHTEQRAFAHLALSVAKGGPKMKEVQFDTAAPRMSYRLGHIIHPQISMYTLALLLSRQTRTMVLDQTGLKGLFQIDLQWTPEGADTDTGPSLFTAIQQQLGLRLEGRKDPIDVMVVDGADRVPVEN